MGQKVVSDGGVQEDVWCALWEGVWMCIIGGYVAQCMCEDEGVKLCGCEKGRTEESW